MFVRTGTWYSNDLNKYGFNKFFPLKLSGLWFIPFFSFFPCFFPYSVFSDLREDKGRVMWVWVWGEVPIAGDFMPSWV